MTGVLSGIIGSIKGSSPPKTAPTSLSAIATNTNVAISFTAPSDDGGSAITNYEYSFNNSSWTALSPADAVSPITVSGLTQSTAYNIYLRAVNINGSGPASSAVSFTTQGAPSVTIGATTGVTESRAVFNATVNGNLANTTVVFHYSTASNFSSYTSVAGSGSGTGSFSSSATVTGLTTATVVDQAATTYYVRAVVTSSIGSVTSGSTSFSTWTLRQAVYSSNGSFTVPTVAGVNPTALPVVLLIGGGGGGAYAGGGGGAGGILARYNYAFTGSSGALTITVGGGAGPGTSSNGGNGGTGTSSTLSGPNLTSISAGGGEGGITNGRGGNVGTGDNPAYTGGSAYAEGGKIATIHSGGGAGSDGNGANGTSAGGGAGGAGNGFWGNSGGGGGGAIIGNGLEGAHGSPNNVGAGGNGGGNDGTGASRAPASGSTGIVVFQYFGT